MADLNKGAFGTLDDGMCDCLGCSLNGSARHKQQNSQNCKNNTSRDVSHIKAARSHAPDVVEFNEEKQEGGWIFFMKKHCGAGVRPLTPHRSAPQTHSCKTREQTQERIYWVGASSSE